MFAFCSLASALRIPRRMMPQINYTKINNTDVDKFIKEHKNAIIVFSDTTKTMKNIRLAIDDNSEYISFAYTKPNPEDNKYCIAYPCASAFMNGEHMRSTISHFTPLSFQFWTAHTISEPHFDVVHSEELRQIMLLPGNHLFAVDLPTRAPFIPKDKIVYHVSKKLFKVFDFMPSRGMYVFRHADRQWIALHNWDTEQITSPLCDVGYDNLKSRKYLAAYILDHQEDDVDLAAINVMSKAAVEGNSDFHYTIVGDDDIESFSYIGHFTQMCGQMLIVFNTSDFRGHRWADMGIEYDQSPERITGFLESVHRGAIKPGISQASKPLRPFGVSELSYFDFDDRAKKCQNGSIVIITSSCAAIPDTYSALMLSGSRVYGRRGVPFFAFDAGRNDSPGLPMLRKYPKIVGYAANGTEKWFEKDEVNLQSFARFVTSITGVELNMTEKAEFQSGIYEYLNTEEEANEVPAYMDDL